LVGGGKGNRAQVRDGKRKKKESDRGPQRGKKRTYRNGKIKVRERESGSSGRQKVVVCRR